MIARCAAFNSRKSSAYVKQTTEKSRVPRHFIQQRLNATQTTVPRRLLTPTEGLGQRPCYRSTLSVQCVCVWHGCSGRDAYAGCLLGAYSLHCSGPSANCPHTTATNSVESFPLNNRRLRFYISPLEPVENVLQTQRWRATRWH